MTPPRRDRLTGLLFLLPFPAFAGGAHLLEALRVADHRQLVCGVLLVLANSALVLAIGARLFGVLRARSEATAAGYLAVRVLEALLLSVGAVVALMVAGAPNATNDVLVLLGAAKGWTYQLGMLSLGVGSVPMCWQLLRSGLVPKPLAGLGLVGYVALAGGAVAELAGLPWGLIASAPGGLFELSFGVFVLAKGLPRS